MEFPPNLKKLPMHDAEFALSDELIEANLRNALFTLPDPKHPLKEADTECIPSLLWNLCVQQKDLAQFIGISEAVVSEWMTGKAQIPKEHAYKIIRALAFLVCREDIESSSGDYDSYVEKHYPNHDIDNEQECLLIEFELSRGIDLLIPEHIYKKGLRKAKEARREARRAKTIAENMMLTYAFELLPRGDVEILAEMATALIKAHGKRGKELASQYDKLRRNIIRYDDFSFASDHEKDPAIEKLNELAEATLNEIGKIADDPRVNMEREIFGRWRGKNI